MTYSPRQQGELCLYYRSLRAQDRWLPFDRYPRTIIRQLARGGPRVGGVDKVFLNLCLGLDRISVPYHINKPFCHLKASDQVAILGRGRQCLSGYSQPNPIVAGIGLMTHPSEWPNLCEEYPVVRYLQHSKWANDVYRPYFGERCVIWPVGIDTDEWRPTTVRKITTFLIYDKILWDRSRKEVELLQPIRDRLRKCRLSFREIRYGNYRPYEFQKALKDSDAMIFLCEHESQGIAYQEALSSGVPILAWDQGSCQDPNRFTWGDPDIPTSSVPYWDQRCGITFQRITEFDSALDEFLIKLKEQAFAPREFILENLTLAACAARFVQIIEESFWESRVKASGTR